MSDLECTMAARANTHCRGRLYPPHLASAVGIAVDRPCDIALYSAGKGKVPWRRLPDTRSLGRRCCYPVCVALQIWLMAVGSAHCTELKLWPKQFCVWRATFPTTAVNVPHVVTEFDVNPPPTDLGAAQRKRRPNVLLENIKKA